MGKEKRGDWPVAVRVLGEDEARKLSHDTPDGDHKRDKENHKRQLDDEKRRPHPAEKAHEDDDNE